LNETYQVAFKPFVTDIIAGDFGFRPVARRISLNRAGIQGVFAENGSFNGLSKSVDSLSIRMGDIKFFDPGINDFRNF
jgi:hypothetical protein